MAHSIKLIRVDNRGRELQNVRAVAQRLKGGDVLLIGRDADELREIAEIVARALVLGLFPALGLALLTGTLLSKRAQWRIDEMNRRVKGWSPASSRSGCRLVAMTIRSTDWRRSSTKCWIRSSGWWGTRERRRRYRT